MLSRWPRPAAVLVLPHATPAGSTVMVWRAAMCKTRRVGGPLDPVPRDQVGDGVQHAELFGQQPQVGAGDDGPRPSSCRASSKAPSVSRAGMECSRCCGLEVKPQARLYS